MDRRTFLKGLVASIAAAALPIDLLLPEKEMLLIGTNDKLAAPIGEWFSILVSYDKESTSCYLNGELIAKFVGRDMVAYVDDTSGMISFKPNIGDTTECRSHSATLKIMNDDAIGIGGSIPNISQVRTFNRNLHEDEIKLLSNELPPTYSLNEPVTGNYTYKRQYGG